MGPGRYPGSLVQFRAGEPRTAELAAHGRAERKLGASIARVHHSSGRLDADVVEVPRGQERHAIALYEADPAVLVVEQDQQAVNPTADDCDTPNSCFVPNDPDFRKQWTLRSWSGTTSPPFGSPLPDADIDAPQAWTRSRGASSVIAVVDDGIDLSHPDLASRIAYASDFTGSGTVQGFGGHGTHVAGIAAAIGNNGVGISGVAPEASLMICRVISTSKKGVETSSNSWLYDGLNYAISNNATVVNMSLGGYANSAAIQNLINVGAQTGITFVAAAGNDGSTTPSYPAAYDNVISVANLTPTDTRATTSNHGSWVDIAAGGTDVWSTLPTYANSLVSRSYGYLTGTSMAAPQVAGTVALLRTLVPDTNGSGYNNDEIQARLMSSADKIAGTGSDWQWGALNAGQAVNGINVGNSYRDAVLATAGLASYWRLNEGNASLGALDSIAGRNGVYDSRVVSVAPFTFQAQGAIPSSADPGVLFGHGLDSSGVWTSGNFRVPVNSNLGMGSTYSVEFWARLSNGADACDRLLAYGNLNTAELEVRCDPQGNLSVVEGAPGDPVLARSSIPFPRTGWHQLVLAKDAIETRLYLDGVDVTTNGQPADVPTDSSAELTLGGWGGSFGVDGLDEVALYSRKLTAADVSAHFASARIGGRG